MQGTKKVSLDFYKLITSDFVTIDTHPTSIDNGFFVVLFEKRSIVSLYLSTDGDILASRDDKIHNMINNEAKKAFDITPKTSETLNHLNYWIK